VRASRLLNTAAFERGPIPGASPIGISAMRIRYDAESAGTL